jgi:hypothetical protein
MDHSQSNTPVTPVSSNEEIKDEAVSPARRSSQLALAGGAVWMIVVFSALGFITNYSNSPGTAGSIPDRWLPESQITLDKNRPTLILFAHPHCPCTRASVDELDRLMAQRKDRLSAHVIFIRPEGMSEDWTRTALWEKASAIPGVTVHSDIAGAESRRFHVETSGQTVLYDPKGRLLFQGGITVSRGHSGDNPGRAALASLVDHNIAQEVKTPVFGCPLFGEECKEGGVACDL